MPNFTGQLNTNEIFASIFNMIISQQVFSDNLAHNYNLVDEAREDGGLYGDTKLYYDADILASREWGADAEATNLLQLKRPKAPNVQSIVLNRFRIVELTIDYYLTKRAWMGEGVFGQFTALMLSQLGETKRVFENTMYNVYIGNVSSTEGKQKVALTYTLPTGVSLGTEEANRLTGQFIAQSIADLIVELKDYSRDYTDRKNLRSYSEDSLKFVWNSKFVNQITYVDLPTIFHNEELRKHLTERILPPKYFGSGITTTSAAAGANERAAEEIAIGTTDYFGGDQITAGTGNGVERKIYTVNPNIVCKVFVKLPPIMSAFEIETSFFNPKSLTENHYLIWGFNELEYLKNYPVIEVSLAVSEASKA